MFNTSLVEVDGSPVARAVISAAGDIAEKYNAALHIVYVIETGWSEGDVTRELVIRELEEESNAILTGIEQDLSRRGYSTKIHRKRGHPGEVIVTLAEEIHADLIMLGSVGKSQIARMLSGSVSTFVFTHSRVATLVIRS